MARLARFREEEPDSPRDLRNLERTSGHAVRRVSAPMIADRMYNCFKPEEIETPTGFDSRVL
jgi:hypothetical protein